MEHPFFHDLVVVELATVLAGPAVGLFFAELGAQVHKIENPKTGGDVTRHWKAGTEDPAAAKSAYYHSVNWNKTVHFLDLTDDSDRQQALDLIATADVVLCNYRHGAAERLGMDSASLWKTNPRLIYANISAYGDDDPRPGFDALLQAETGWMFMNGTPESPPVKLPVALIDLLAAHQLKQGILVALLQRERSQTGGRVSVSLFDSSISALANQASNWLNIQHLPQRMGSRHPNIAPYGDVLFSKDGKGMLLATGTEAHFQALCLCLGVPHLAKAENYTSNRLRLLNRDALFEHLQAAFAQADLAHWQTQFAEAGVPASPIRNLAEVFTMPAAQNLLLEQTEADGTASWRVKTAVFKISDANHDAHQTKNARLIKDRGL